MSRDITIIIGCYLLGSISFSLLIGKWWHGIDIRQYGSGNAGATNTRRIMGTGPAIVVLLLDLAKGSLAVLCAHWLADDPSMRVWGGVAAIVGHNWPIYFGFRGGKGIATTIGVLSMVAFWPVVCAGVFAIGIIVWQRYVSLGSLVFTSLVPVFAFIFHCDGSVFWGSLLLCGLAFYRHRHNIVQLMQGTESRLGLDKEGLPRV